MNTFTKYEGQAAYLIADLASSLASAYAEARDQEAATIALLLTALELAGGKHFIKSQENEV